MRITKNQIKRIIREEHRRLIKEEAEAATTPGSASKSDVVSKLKDLIAKSGEGDQRIQRVIPVGAPAGDVQVKIYLGRCANGNGLTHPFWLIRPSSRRAVWF